MDYSWDFLYNANVCELNANFPQHFRVFLLLPQFFWKNVRGYGKMLYLCTQRRAEDWQAETREQLLDRFVSRRPANPAISEDEVMDEVRAVRYAKQNRMVIIKHIDYA